MMEESNLQYTDCEVTERGESRDIVENPEVIECGCASSEGKEKVIKRNACEVIEEEAIERKSPESPEELSVDLSLIERQQEEKTASNLNKISNPRNILKGQPPNKRQIYFSSQNPEILLKNVKNTNRVRMTRYTLLSWAPLSLMNQFKRVSNIYFLLITILTFMPFSPKSPASMVGTFAFVLFFTMLKDGYEDIKRFRQQKEVNRKHTQVLKQMKEKSDSKLSDLFEQRTWEDVRAGQIVMIQKDEDIPADILLMYSSNETGVVSVDTMALDGETNLKEKNSAIEEFKSSIDINQRLSKIQGSAICDQPNENLEHWECLLKINERQERVIACSVKNLLVRGSVLRNTEWAVGISIYTGADTKIFRNSKSPPHKVSNMMKKMNRMLLQVFILQLTIVFLCTGLNYQWAYENYPLHREIGKTLNDYQNLASNLFTQILAFWVTFSHMIPISLYVAIEVLKLSQGMIISQDVKMFDSETMTFANCKNSDLSEELGQVEMIFSDKTGTLTMNKMEFKKCSIAGKRFGDPSDENEKLSAIGMCHSGKLMISNELSTESMTFYKSQQSDFQNSLLNFPVLHFFRALSLCHTVVCDVTQKSDGPIPLYQASSPDELALVQGASDVGIIFKQRAHSNMTIQNSNSAPNHEETFRVLAEFSFDSTRKCMSVLVMEEKSRNIYLYSKGADNVMLEKINFSKHSSGGQEADSYKQSIIDDLYRYSCEGFRTLVIAMRAVSDNEYIIFDKVHSNLQSSTSEFKDRQLSELYSKMEHNLLYLGSTAIEDKLQEGVPETIATLIKAEIRFWVLTGDKLETAIEIAKSCEIIQAETYTITLVPEKGQDTNPRYLRRILNAKAQEIKSISGQAKKSKEHFPSKSVSRGFSLRDYKQENVVIAVEGSTLAMILGNRDLEDRFFQMSLNAKSVICCRVSPKQKADIVGLFKKKGEWVTLSIGDGANDVSMILEASIGVGIRGKEGTQAVRSADYSISQFRFLLRLLLIHGRLGYIRVSKMIFSYFYKNIVLVFTEISFVFFTGFSGQLFFLDWLPTLYNAVFTSWQCLFAYMYERDINEEYALKYPVVYKIGQEDRSFTSIAFWKQILLALWHGMVCFYVPLYGCSGEYPSPNEGKTYEHWYYSTICFALILHLVTYKLFIDSSYWTAFSIGSGLLGLALFYLIVFLAATPIIANLLHPQLNRLMIMISQDIRFYFLLIVVPFICLLPDLTFNMVKQIFFPEVEHTIMHMQSVLGEEPLVLKSQAKLQKQNTRLQKVIRSALKKQVTKIQREDDEQQPNNESAGSKGSSVYQARRYAFMSDAARIQPQPNKQLEKTKTTVTSALKSQDIDKGRNKQNYMYQASRASDASSGDAGLNDTCKKLMINQDSSAQLFNYATPERNIDDDIDEEMQRSGLKSSFARSQETIKASKIKLNQVSSMVNLTPPRQNGPLFGFGLMTDSSALSAKKLFSRNQVISRTEQIMPFDSTQLEKTQLLQNSLAPIMNQFKDPSELAEIFQKIGNALASASPKADFERGNSLIHLQVVPSFEESPVQDSKLYSSHSEATIAQIASFPQPSVVQEQLNAENDLSGLDYHASHHMNSDPSPSASAMVNLAPADQGGNNSSVQLSNSSSIKKFPPPKKSPKKERTKEDSSLFVSSPYWFKHTIKPQEQKH